LEHRGAPGRIVRKALRKERDARYQTLKSQLADLKELRDEHSSSGQSVHRPEGR
jgi:hypothetical protein